MHKIQNSLVLADKFNKPLFELIPDYFPQGRLTDVEIELWNKYYKKKKEESKET